MSLLSAAVLLFLVIDPFGNAPFFLCVLKGVSTDRHTKIIIRELFIALGVLIIFLLFGHHPLAFLHISKPSLSIAGGKLDMGLCRYEQWDEKTVRITGKHFLLEAGKIHFKLEGSGKIGERFIGIVGIRDPYMIQNLDKVIGWAKSHVEEKFDPKEYQLFYHIYGKNGVMGDLEPVKEIKSHELCVVVEGIADTKEKAELVTLTGSRQIFYARLPDVKGTAGTAAFIIDGVLAAPAAYRWTLNHLLPMEDPMELFEIHQEIVA